MTKEVTRQVYQALLARSKNEKLGKKDTRFVADQFGVHIRSVVVKSNLLITFQLWLLVERRVHVVVRQSLLIWNNYATFLSNKE